MGKLRVLSGEEVCRILAQHGFLMVRQRGSHRLMQLQSGGSTLTIPVPLHNPLKPGTLLSIIRQSGLPRVLFETDY